MKALVAVLALLLAFPAYAQNPSPAKMGIIHAQDPEPVSVLDASNVWALMGSIDKTTHTFTPVATGGGGGGPGCTGGTICDTNILNWAGQPVAAPTTVGLSPASGGLVPTVNGYILNSLSIQSSALPTGAATAANQAPINADNGSQVHVMNWPINQPVTATTWPLPTGAATAANQNITAAGTTSANGVGVQGVTGGVPIPVTQTSLPLPAGAATSANQTNGAQKTQSVDGSGNLFGTVSNPLTVNCPGCGGGAVSAGGGGTPQTTAGGPINLSAAGTTVAITGVSGQYTYITQFNVIAGSAGTIKITYGTGAACAGGTPVTVTGTYPWATNNGISLGTGLGSVFPPAPPGYNVCLTAAGTTVSQQGSIGFTQSAALVTSISNGGTPQTTAGAPINITSATTTLVIPNVSGQFTYITQFNVITGSTGNLQLEYGTGTNCGTGTQFLTGSYPWPANGGIGLGSGFGPVFPPVPAGNDVCLVSTGTTVNMQGSVAFTQSATVAGSFGGISSGGTSSGGGLSVQDKNPFTSGTSPMTPVGCAYNSIVPTLATGQQGMVSCGIHRELFIDAMTGSNLLSALSSGAFAVSPGTAMPTSAVAVGGQDLANHAVPLPIDSCAKAKSYVDIKMTTTAGLQLVAGVSGKKIHICAGTSWIASVSAHVSLIEGAGSTCTTPASVYGNDITVAAASGMAFSANGGMQLSGAEPASTQTTGNTLCGLADTASQVNFHVAYVQE